MCDKVILENGGMSTFVPYCYKNQKMCDKAVDSYPFAMQFVFEYYKIQNIYDKALILLYLILSLINIIRKQ